MRPSKPKPKARRYACRRRIFIARITHSRTSRSRYSRAIERRLDMVINGVTKIFAGAASGEGKAQGLYRGGLFRRNPGDGDWQAVNNGLPDNVEVRTIAVHPRDSNIMFVGTQDG